MPSSIHSYSKRNIIPLQPSVGKRFKNLRNLGFENVDYIFNTADVMGYWNAMVELIGPFGHICAITSVQSEINISYLFRKAVSFSFELMFTRTMFQTKDMGRQGKILGEVAKLIDESKLKTTLNHRIWVYL